MAIPLFPMLFVPLLVHTSGCMCTVTDATYC